MTALLSRGTRTSGVARRRHWARRAAPLVAIALLAGLFPSTASGHEADPGEGTVSLEERSLSWQGEQVVVGTAAFPGDTCPIVGSLMCDTFALTVDVDDTHWETSEGGVEISISWEDPNNDFDLHVFDQDSGELVGQSIIANADAGVAEEKVFVEDAAGGYDVIVNAFTVVNSGYDGRVVLQSADDAPGDDPPPGGEVPDEPLFDVACLEGLAGPFPCKNVDLAAYLPLPSIGDANRGNDIWGWTDPETGSEYALMGTTLGTAFVDVTEPTAPVYLGMLPSHQPLVRTIFRQWADVKVYQDHAYIVSEEPLHGMQVFDLTRLRGATSEQTWSEDAHYPLFGGAHNIAINEDSGFAYAIGTATCDGGPHMIDIHDPQSPAFAGCVAEDGYTHDTQAVTYDGPDEQYQGREILFNSNEDSVTIVDVTDKTNPVQLSRTDYPNARYTHQGWLTDDGRYFLFNDELDETGLGINTTTYILDVTSLTDPVMHAEHVHDTPNIDHNLYVKGNLVYEANYRAGLRILDTERIDDGILQEVGVFDVYPGSDSASFNGAWSNYPFFESGTIIVSGIEQGLFVLTPQNCTGDEAEIPGETCLPVT